MGYYTTFFGEGNFFYTTAVQNGVYQNVAFTSPLEWRNAYTAPTPTGSSIIAPTNGVNFPHKMLIGNSEGFWIHRVFLDGHLVGTFTMVDQQFLYLWNMIGSKACACHSLHLKLEQQT